MQQAKLERFAYTPMGTFGKLTIGDLTVFTCERPWLGNQEGVSCIPEGTYELNLRDSGVVQQTTKGRYQKGYEITNVPGRSEIMIHIGNTMDDLEGCVAVGLSLGYINGKWGVASSVLAFDQVMQAFGGTNDWSLEVTHYQPEGM